MKIDKFSKILFVIMCLLFCFFNLVSIQADSGWDSDYDSGGSDWGGSDWGDSDSDWSSSGGSYSGDMSFKDFLIIIIIAAVVLYIMKKNKLTFNNDSEYKYTPVLEDEIKKYLPDFDKKLFLQDAYKIFIDVQNAWSEFDKDKLRNLLSDELYNTYNMQLISLKAKKQKNIMTDFTEVKSDVSYISVENEKVTLKTILEVSFYDYVVDEANTIVRGTKDNKLLMTYELTFISTINKNKTENCPNCGAPINKDDAGDVCEYCKAVIVKNTYDWTLAKKESKNQRRI